MGPPWFEQETESHLTDIDVLQTDVLVSSLGEPVGSETQSAYMTSPHRHWHVCIIPADMVLVEIVIMLLLSPNAAVTLTWHLLPGLRDDMLKWMEFPLTTLEFVFAKFCHESHNRWQK